MKKTWESPRLIVLMRTRPQESILTVCKGQQAGVVVSPYNEWSYCTLDNQECSCCSIEVTS